MQRICSEPGLWPESIKELDAEELDILIEHAAECSYHLSLLDHDEEEFLTDLKQTWSLIFADGLNSRTLTDASEIEWPLPEVNRPVGASTTGCTGDRLYDSYRRWSEQRCPLEILHVRYGDRTLGTFDVTRDRGTWRLNVNKGHGVLQFWALCRRHNDKVRIAACDLPQHGPAQSEVSTLLFQNGQSLSLQSSRLEGGDFSVLVQCTAPPPLDLRFNAYNFDAVIDYLELGSGLECCKSSQVVKDLDKFAELRFPLPDMEAALLPNVHQRKKCVDELLRLMADEREIESLAPACASIGATPLATLESGPNRAARVVKLLKKWVEDQKEKKREMYQFLGRSSMFTSCTFRVEKSGSIETSNNDEVSETLIPFHTRANERFFYGAGVVNFVLLCRDGRYESSVTAFTDRQNALSRSSVCGGIAKAYVELRTNFQPFASSGNDGPATPVATLCPRESRHLDTNNGDPDVAVAHLPSRGLGQKAKSCVSESNSLKGCSTVPEMASEMRSSLSTRMQSFISELFWW